MTKTPEELREILTEVALQTAQRVLRSGENEDLQVAQVIEPVTVDGKEWKVEATYHAESGVVMLEGNGPPNAEVRGVDREDLPEGVPPFIAQMMGIGSIEMEKFMYAVPVAWLRKLRGAER